MRTMETMAEMDQTQESSTLNSPLGSLSQLYLVKKPDHGSILDQPSKKLFEFYPAGYTKMTAEKKPRQQSLKTLYEIAVSLEGEAKEYPFGKANHAIYLEPEPSNQFDQHAIKVMLSAPAGSPLEELNGAELGYVPQKISKELSEHIGMVKGGVVLKVKNGVHGKYYSAKVIFTYNAEGFSPLTAESAVRFAAIMED